MSKIGNIRVIMHKTLHHVPKILTTKLIKHKSVKGTRVVQRETLETFNYRRAFYTTTAIILLIAVGIGYGIFAAMNIGLTKEEAKSNLLSQFNNSDEVGDILDRKDVDPLTYIFNKDLDNNKVYTFTGTRNSLLEHDITSNVYRVKDTTPTNVPTTVKRAYSREDIEANYVKSVDGVELSGLKTGRERNPNTYILKSNFNEQTVYAFTGTGIETQQHNVTSNVYHVEDKLPNLAPSNVQRAYSKEDIENNYVKRLEGNKLLGLETKVEVDPNTYILKSNFNSNQIYTINGTKTNKELEDSTNSILYTGNNKDVNLPENISTRGYTKNAIENTYIRPTEVNDLEGLTTNNASDPRLYTWDHEFNLDTAYTFRGTIINKKSHVVTNSLYYIGDTKEDLIPTGVKKAYSKQDVEVNYVLKSGQHNLKGINASYERSELSNDHVYSFSGDGISKPKDFNKITDSVHYSGEIRPTNVPSSVTRAYTAKEVEESYVLNLNNNNIGGIRALKEVDPETYIKNNTLASNIYYQSIGQGNNLRVDPLIIKEGEIYKGINHLNNNDNKGPFLELVDLYVEGDLDETLYVLDNIDPNSPELKPTNHMVGKSYEIVGEKRDTNLKLSDKEVLSLENKMSLFQKEKLTNAFDRYGKYNWYDWWSYRSYSFENRNTPTTSCHGKTFRYINFVTLANNSLPEGAKYTDKEIQYIANNIGKYRFRISFGSSVPEYKDSIGVLLNTDGTEWDGVKENPTKVDLSPSEFPSEAKTKKDDYLWIIQKVAGAQILWVKPFDSIETENSEKICKSSIRGVEIYKDPLLT